MRLARSTECVQASDSHRLSSYAIRPSPRIGVVSCNSSDATQHWVLDPKTSQLNNGPKHDMNAGPTCPGDAGNSMLLYPAQGHANEKYTHDAASGKIHFGAATGGKSCLTVSESSPPPPPPPAARNISVSWAQLGWAPGRKASVRRHEGSFSHSLSHSLSLHLCPYWPRSLAFFCLCIGLGRLLLLLNLLFVILLIVLSSASPFPPRPYGSASFLKFSAAPILGAGARSLGEERSRRAGRGLLGVCSVPRGFDLRLDTISLTREGIFSLSLKA